MSDLQASKLSRPPSWSQFKARYKHKTLLTISAWLYSWLVYWSEQWTLLRVLDAAGKFVIVIAVFQWFFESGSRAKERHYKAWQIINSARGASGDGGRIDALQDLNKDGVSLASAPLSNAYLLSVKLPKSQLRAAALDNANLLEANLSNADLFLANLTNANLARAKLYAADLTSAKLIKANLVGSDLSKAKLVSADLSGANLLNATLLEADLSNAVTDSATFCGTVMPNGDINNTNCSKNKTTDVLPMQR